MRQDLSLAKCDNRRIIARDHPTIKGPQEWIAPGHTIWNDLTFLNFDFFVDWSDEKIQVANEIWLKMPVHKNFFQKIEGDEGKQTRDLLARQPDFIELVRFGKNNKFNVAAIVFDDSADFPNTKNILKFSVPFGEHSFSCERLDLQQLCALIQKHSGGLVRVGKKGLIYGTTRLECFLSNTDAAWPGDIDALLVDTKNGYAAKAIFEFKKCTNRARVSFDDETFPNYYPSPDRRKYDRLLSFGRRMAPEGGLPIHLVFYSNQEMEKRLIIEIITSNGDQAKVAHRKIYADRAQNAADIRSILSEHIGFHC